LERIVIRRLVAHDEARGDVVIEPGARIESFEIQRAPDGYVMRFVSGSREMRCALAEFQARTESADAVEAPTAKM
jgi:hypothetical protein